MIGTSEYSAESRVIHSGPCVVRAVHVAGDAVNGDCQVYDGVNTNGSLKAHLEVLAGTSYTWMPGEGTDFDLGVYLAVNAATTKVTVTFIPESRKKFI